MATARPEDQVFFLYDHTALQREEDDLKDAIKYFFPNSISVDNQCAICGQLMGMVEYFQNFLSKSPRLFTLEKNKIAVKHVGKYTLALAGNRQEPNNVIFRQLDSLYDIFLFYQGGMEELAKTCDEEDQGFINVLQSVWDCYLPFIRRYGDSLAASFESIPAVELPKTMSSLFLQATHLLQYTRKQEGVLGGCLLYKGRVLCTQLPPGISSRLLIIRPKQSHFPCRQITPGFQVPAGIRILSVFLKPDEYSKINADYSHESLPSVKNDFQESCSLSNKNQDRDIESEKNQSRVDAAMAMPEDPTDSNKDQNVRTVSMGSTEPDTDIDSLPGGKFSVLRDGVVSVHVHCTEDECRDNNALSEDIGSATDVQCSKDTIPKEVSVLGEIEDHLENTDVNPQEITIDIVNDSVQGLTSVDRVNCDDPVVQEKSSIDTGNEALLPNDQEENQAGLLNSSRNSHENAESKDVVITGDTASTHKITSEESASETQCSDGSEDRNTESGGFSRKSSVENSPIKSKKMANTASAFQNVKRIAAKNSTVLEKMTRQMEIENALESDEEESVLHGLSNLLSDLKQESESVVAAAEKDNHKNEVNGGKQDENMSGVSKNTLLCDTNVKHGDDHYRERGQKGANQKGKLNSPRKQFGEGIARLIYSPNRRKSSSEEGNLKEAPRIGRSASIPENSSQIKPTKAVKTTHDSSLINVDLFIQGNSEIVLLLLMEKDAACDCDTVRKLWKITLPQLGEIEVQLKSTNFNEKHMANQKLLGYNFLTYDSFMKSLSGNMLRPMSSLENNFCETAICMKDEFERLPLLADITLRTHTTSVYGHRSGSQQVYYQPKNGKQQPGIPSARDPNLALDNKAYMQLLKDQNIHII